MGQGLNTKIRQLVADEFAISYKDVKLMITSTEKNNNTPPTAASASTDLNGIAAVNACQKIRSKLCAIASKYFATQKGGLKPSIKQICFEDNSVFDQRNQKNKLSFRKLVQLAFMERVSMGERGFYQTPKIHFNRDTEKGEPFFYYTMAVSYTHLTLPTIYSV